MHTKACKQPWVVVVEEVVVGPSLLAVALVDYNMMIVDIDQDMLMLQQEQQLVLELDL